MPTISKKQMQEYEQFLRDRDSGRILTPDGIRLICASFENDPQKIGTHMLTILAKFKNEGLFDHRISYEYLGVKLTAVSSVEQKETVAIAALSQATRYPNYPGKGVRLSPVDSYYPCSSSSVNGIFAQVSSSSYHHPSAIWSVRLPDSSYNITL